MLHHLGTGDGSVLVDVTDNKDGNIHRFGKIDEDLGTFPHLCDAAGGGIEGGKVHRLDGIHHHDVRFGALDGFHDRFDVGGGAQMQVRRVHSQAGGAQLDLPQALLARYI